MRFISATTTKPFNGAHTLRRWAADARATSRTPNLAYWGARYRATYFDRARRIRMPGYDSGDRQQRLLMRKYIRSLRRVFGRTLKGLGVVLMDGVIIGVRHEGAVDAAI